MKLFRLNVRISSCDFNLSNLQKKNVDPNASPAFRPPNPFRLNTPSTLFVCHVDFAHTLPTATEQIRKKTNLICGCNLTFFLLYPYVITVGLLWRDNRIIIIRYYYLCAWPANKYVR